MALADITKKIIDDAESEAKQILISATKKKGDIDKQTTIFISEATEAANNKWKNLVLQAEEKQLANKKQEGRKKIESYKRQVLDEIFQQAQKELSGLRGEKRQHLIKEMLNQLPNNWSGYIKVAPADAKLVKELSNDKTNIKSISPAEELSGGFIASNDTSEYNFSFEHILTIVKNQQENLVAKILFKQK